MEDSDAQALQEASVKDSTKRRIAPEVDPATAGLTTWDEPENAAGTKTPNVSSGDDTTVAEQLVDEGLEEADREQRIAAEDPDFEP